MFRNLWSFCCSLKVTIVLASAATLTAMGGSLLIPSRTAVFGPMDRMPLGEWLSGIAMDNFNSTWWVFVTLFLLVLLGVNTACCFIDWIFQFRSRWRKSGEYMIHLGFVLIVTGYTVGSLSGFRTEGHQLAVGERIAVPHRDGLYLRLEGFEPRFGEDGGFLDMVNDLTLLKANQEVARGTVRINHPMQAEGLLVLATSFGREPVGFRFASATREQLVLKENTSISLDDDLQLSVGRFYPDAVLNGRGNIVPRSSKIGNPAFEVTLNDDSRIVWDGWYFLRQGLPEPLSRFGVQLRPLEPVFEPYSVLTINSDPGVPLALAGGLSMSIGVVFALFSYYTKRRRRDRPQVD
ncbi:MAG: cytochrome c biogenesis protein ResB [Desulfuromonadales bacterium]